MSAAIRAEVEAREARRQRSTRRLKSVAAIVAAVAIGVAMGFMAQPGGEGQDAGFTVGLAAAAANERPGR